MTSPAWRVVPVEGTCAMQAAWNAAEDDGWDAAHAAYLKAAPRPDYDALAVELEATGLPLAAALRATFEGE